MNESFLHYVWRFQRFDNKRLATTRGLPIRVFAQGEHNRDAGPDFLNARIRIGDVDWVGNVEIHVCSGAWYDHGHDKDPAYRNVILHVVWTDDKPVSLPAGTPLPTLVLKGRVGLSLLNRYQQLLKSPLSIPCQRQLPDVDALVKTSMLEKAALQRLEDKTEQIMRMFRDNGADWEETAYQLVAQNFGFKTNREPFLQLSRAVPLKLALRQGDDLMRIEALLLGQAGFLEDPADDDYAQLLRREHAALSRQYNLRAPEPAAAMWRFLRLRPANFPTLRIAQFSALIFAVKSLFSNIIETPTVEELRALFSVTPSPYWQRHYRLGKKAAHRHAGPGRHSIDNLIINTVAPLLVAYGRYQDRQEAVDRALRFLEGTPAEKNHITRIWAPMGMTPDSALASQGLLELYRNFCLKKRCLSCHIGVKLLAADA